MSVAALSNATCLQLRAMLSLRAPKKMPKYLMCQINAINHFVLALININFHR